MKKFEVWIIVLAAVIILLIGFGGGWLFVKSKITSNTLAEYTSPKGAIVKVKTPTKNQKISSPLEITGEVRGNWSFEASFPIILADENKNTLSEGIATLEGDWMTTNFVPFKAVLNFSKPAGSRGILIFKKDDPSDQPAFQDSVEIPIRF